MEAAAAIGTFIAENAGAIQAGAAVAGAGTSIYSATRKPGKPRTPIAVVSANDAAKNVGETDEEKRRKLASKVGSTLTRNWGNSQLGQSALLGV